MDPLIDTLVAERKRQGVTQEKLATEARLSRRALVSIEAGGDCTLTTLRRLFSALGMDMVAVPSAYRPPTLEDVMAENAALFANSVPRQP